LAFANARSVESDFAELDAIDFEVSGVKNQWFSRIKPEASDCQYL